MEAHRVGAGGDGSRHSWSLKRARLKRPHAEMVEDRPRGLAAGDEEAPHPCSRNPQAICPSAFSTASAARLRPNRSCIAATLPGGLVVAMVTGPAGKLLPRPVQRAPHRPWIADDVFDRNAQHRTMLLERLDLFFRAFRAASGENRRRAW